MLRQGVANQCALHGFCKHRLSAAIAKRARELTTGKLDTATPAGQPTPAQPPAPTAPLPEAPASVNVHVEIGGRQVQLTLRDSDEGRLLVRLEAVLQRFPLVVTPTSERAPAEGWCSKHGVAMRQRDGEETCWRSADLPQSVACLARPTP